MFWDLAISTLLAASSYLLWRRSRSPKLPLPPGPKGLPLLGSALDLRVTEVWLKVQAWAKQFGDVTHTHAFGQHIVFLNSRKAVSDLLEKRGSIYSDRAQLVMLTELCGLGEWHPMVNYGDQFKRQRKLFNTALGSQVIPKYHPFMQQQAVFLVRRLLNNPDKLQPHIRRYAGGLTLQLVYGYKVTKDDDKLLSHADEMLDILTNDIMPTGKVWPVDVLPFLKYLPSWMPGTGFQRKAARWKAGFHTMANEPYEWFQGSLKRGFHDPSFCSIVLEDAANADDDSELKWTAATIYGASLDTVITTVASFIHLMLKHPHVLEKARQEMDTVVGRDRLPTFTDRSRLTYLAAVINEVYRYTSPSPLGLPHVLRQDDIYEGMLLPKNSLVFPNMWMILHDEELYPSPDSFLPERFLDLTPERAKQMEPRNHMFGFGRRVCPGNHLVDSATWVVVATMVATLEMSKAKDSEGRDIEPLVEYHNAVFRVPSEFEFTTRARDAQASQLLETF